jgi:hypothetical protein
VQVEHLRKEVQVLHQEMQYMQETHVEMAQKAIEAQSMQAEVRACACSHRPLYVCSCRD